MSHPALSAGRPCVHAGEMLAGKQLQNGGREKTMSGVRVLVGTRKGAFVLTSDGKRKDVGYQPAPTSRAGRSII